MKHNVTNVSRCSAHSRIPCPEAQVSKICLRKARQGQTGIGTGQIARSAVCKAAGVVQAATTESHVASKQSLLEALSRIPDTGVYGIPDAEKQSILSLVEVVEAGNTLHAPTEHLEKVAGTWRLLYSTISILGRRRIKLGLKNIVNVGELTQHVDIQRQHSVNVVNFDILVFGKFKGSLTLEASYTVVGPQRVAITLEEATLVPEQFQQLFEKNYDLLLSIFNPEGFLDITYVDEQHRIGRDDKGHVYILEKLTPS